MFFLFPILMLSIIFSSIPYRSALFFWDEVEILTGHKDVDMSFPLFMTIFLFSPLVWVIILGRHLSKHFFQQKKVRVAVEDTTHDLTLEEYEAQRLQEEIEEWDNRFIEERYKKTEPMRQFIKMVDRKFK